MTAELGVTYSLSPAIDCLHTLYLGPFKMYCKLVLWSLLNARVWGSLQLTVSEGLQLAVNRLRGALWDWYKERHEKFPKENLTKLAELTHKMLGTPADPLLKTKAAETWGLVHFCVDKTLEHRHALGRTGLPLHEAGKCIVEHIQVMKNHGCRLPASAIQSLHDTLKRHLLSLIDIAEDLPFEWELPKHHLWVHMVNRVSKTGNPRLVDNFLNESLNKLLKSTCKYASQITFERSVLYKMKGAMRSLEKKRQRESG